MKILSLSFLITMITLSSYNAKAQEYSLQRDTIIWNVNQLTDIAHDSTMNYSCQFETYGNNKIVWIQKNEYITSFSITGTDGKWPDQTQDGNIVFAIKSNGKKGTISLLRKMGAITVEINLVEKGVAVYPHIFHVNSISIKP